MEVSFLVTHCLRRGRHEMEWKIKKKQHRNPKTYGDIRVIHDFLHIVQCRQVFIHRGKAHVHTEVVIHIFICKIWHKTD